MGCSSRRTSTPFYPGPGGVPEVGHGAGEGYTVNVPIGTRMGDGEYAAVFAEVLEPIATEYNPDLVLVSAGFDAHVADPLGGMAVTDEGFAVLCAMTKRIAERCAEGRLALLLEGGYDLEGLASSVRACVEVLEGATPPDVAGAQLGGGGPDQGGAGRAAWVSAGRGLTTLASASPGAPIRAEKFHITAVATFIPLVSLAPLSHRPAYSHAGANLSRESSGRVVMASTLSN